MYGEFFKLLGEAKLGNEESMVEVIDRFRPTIKKFSRELGYETAETDLVIELISILKKIKLDSLENYDGAAVNYIYSSLKMRKIDLFRKYVKGFKEELALNIDIIDNSLQDNNYLDVENKIFVKEILQLLNKKQRYVLVKKVIEGYSDVEIANHLHISRQAVNKLQNNALNFLRSHLRFETDLKKLH